MRWFRSLNKIKWEAREYAHFRFPVALNPDAKQQREYIKQAYIAGALGTYKHQHFRKRRGILKKRL